MNDVISLYLIGLELWFLIGLGVVGRNYFAPGGSDSDFVGFVLYGILAGINSSCLIYWFSSPCSSI